MAELNTNTIEEPHLLPPKRKQPAENLDANAAEEAAKKLRPDNAVPAAAVEDKITEKNGAKFEPENEEEEDYEGEEEEEDDDDDVENGGNEVVVDRKEGIMKDDKGKGKMIEEKEEEDDDDDSDDSGDSVDLSDSDSDDDDDLSDDPLTEVDLENILPSRTRGRTITPGLKISKDNNNADT